MVSATTRPPRDGEQNGLDYYFVSNRQFEKLIENNQLIEFTHFRKWHYGIPYNEVKKGYINIGVFNPEGLETLQRLRYDYWVIPIYIEERFDVRLWRSHDREGKWKLEYFRRLITDYFDFKNIDRLLKKFRGKYVLLRDMGNLWRQANTVERALYYWGILIKDGDKVRLGNFV